MARPDRYRGARARRQEARAGESRDIGKACVEGLNGKREGRGERGAMEAGGKGQGEARRALQAKSIERVGGAANNITCGSRARHEGSPCSRARAVGHEIGFRAQRSDYPYRGA